MVNIRTAISTSAATLVSLSAVTGVGAASAQAEESTGAQPGTDTTASDDSDAQAASEAQPGTDTDNNSAGSNGGEEESTAANNAQPGTEIDAQLPNQSNIPAQPANNAQLGTETAPTASDESQPGTEAETPAPKPVESDNGNNNSATPQWSDEVISEQPAAEPAINNEPVDIATEPTYQPAVHTTEPAVEEQPIVDQPAVVPQNGEVEDASEAEDIQPVEENHQPAAQAVESAPAQPEQPEQPAPTSVPAPSQPEPAPAAPVETNEVEGASATVRAPGITVTAQGTAQPFDGDVTISTAAGENTVALPANEVAFIQQAGQNAASTLPDYAQENLNNLHNAVIDHVENLPTSQSGELGAVSADMTIDHKTV